MHWNMTIQVEIKLKF